MAILLSCREVAKDFGEKSVLKNVNFDIATGERVGLVGCNGAGKTTLVNIIAGEIEADGGTLLWHTKSVNIGYLRQESAYVRSRLCEESIKDYLHTSSQLSLKKVYEWDEVRLKHLSSGEKTKLALAQIWSMNPDFLILDEPTNHLDYEGVKWLIKELKRYRGTILVISHDRYFLDECVTKIIEVERSHLQEYRGNYSFYREEKKRRYDSQLNLYLEQKEIKRKIDDQINNLKNWSERAHRDAPKKAIASGNKMGGKEFLRAKAKKMDIQVKSRINKLEKIEIEGVEKPQKEIKIDFKLKSAEFKGIRIIEASGITKAFNSKQLFNESSFYVQRGEKVGIVGKNGCGKTTLLKLLMGTQKVDKGEIFLSSSAKLGYLSQDIDHLDLEKKMIDYLQIKSRQDRIRIQTLLIKMGFSEDMLSQSLGSLSLGELTRLRMIELIIYACDLLILDEPLNHLDLNSREKLEEVLADYNGTLLLVSHDRYMMEKICDKVLVFGNNKVSRLEFGLKEFLEGKHSGSEAHHKSLKEEKMLIENEMSYVLGELCKHAQGTEQYAIMDLRFKELNDRRKEINEELIRQSDIQ